MGLSGIGTWQLLIILVIVVLIFGTKRLKTLGGDLGSAMKSFRKAMHTEDDDKDHDDERKQIGAEAERDAEFTEHKDKERHG